MYSYKDFLSKKLYYAKELYEHEAEVRRQTSGKFSITITIYTAIIAAWVTLFSKIIGNIDIKRLSLMDTTLFIILFATIILVIVSICFFTDCFINYKERVVEPIQVKDLFKDGESLINEYELSEIINSIDDVMANSYMECAIHNYKQTTKKIKLLNKAYRFIVISIVDLFAGFLMYSV